MQGKVGPQYTHWFKGEEGDLLQRRHNDPSWTNVTMNSYEFPMDADKVARLMNYAFKLGMNAKLEQIQDVMRPREVDTVY